MFSRSLLHVFSLTVVLLTQPILALATEATFSWAPNSEANLAGYKIHYGTASSTYSTTINVGLPALVNGRVTATVTGLQDGATYYFASTAYDSTGLESGYSNEANLSLAAVNDQPIAQADSFEVIENNSYQGQLAGSDPDQDPLVFTIAEQPQYGSITLNADGSFSYTSYSNANGSDAFTFTVSDGQLESLPATVSITVTPSGQLPIEAGEVSIDHNAARITFAQKFTQPVVVANLITRNASDPCVVRISNVDATGFTIRLQEYEYLDGIHIKETISYIVMEKGNYTLEDGSLIEAGTFETAATTALFQPLMLAMQTTPVILSSIVTTNEAQAVTGRIRNVSTSGFEYLLQEQEKNAKSHAKETVAYIAWEPGNGIQSGMRYAVKATLTNNTNKTKTIGFDQAFTTRPFVLAGMQTTNEIDPSILRIARATTMTGITVLVEEEKSLDRETTHANEQAGYLAIMME
ncbi:MAG: cadherin-like domain-containing protein [Chlorobium sp.]|nr:cadherin-like domain-containing protein [Chlorobium sp.]